MTTKLPTMQVSRKPLFTFLGLVSVLAALSYAIAFSGDEGNAPGGLLLVQFAPALSAIITKLIYQHNLRGLGWGWGKTRYQVISYLLPFGLALVSFGVVWLLGFGGFYNEAFVAEAQVSIAAIVSYPEIEQNQQSIVSTSRCFPIFKNQVGYPPKLAHVVRHQRAAVGQSNGCDLQVIGPNGCAQIGQPGAHCTRDLGGPVIEGQRAKGAQELLLHR